MKKLFFLVTITSIALFYSCEKDDICLQPTTPEFVIRFYNANAVDATKQVTLTVWTAERDTLLASSNTDSISVPLFVDSIQATTTYILASSDTIAPDTLSISYRVDDIFVSRSCGFKSIFEQVNITLHSNHWIQDIVLLESTILTDTSAHVKIFH